MNRIATAIIVGVLIVILGIGTYFALKKSSVPIASPKASQSVKAHNIEALQGTLRSLLTQAKPVSCSFANTSQAADVRGLVYVAKGRMRGDFTTTIVKNTITGHMVVGSSYSYIWTDMTNIGIKVPLSSSLASASANVKAPDINQTFSYTCQNWSEDDSVFALPTNISFQEITIPSIVPTNASSSATGATSPQCSACNSIPLAAQAACKAQFHCQ